MFHLCKSITTNKYRFYDEKSHSFTIIGTSNVAKEYRQFVNDILLGTSPNFLSQPHITIVASSPTIESFPDLYPEFFI